MDASDPSVILEGPKAVGRATPSVTDGAARQGIEVADENDLDALIGSMGQDDFFRERFERQVAGRGQLFVAWRDGVPVGDVYLWLEAAEEPPLRAALPGVALITHLEIRPDWRDRGIGSRIVKECERYLLERGHSHVALGVDPQNHGAIRLYERLGFKDWGRGVLKTDDVRLVSEGGVLKEIRVPEECRVFVKELG